MFILLSTGALIERFVCRCIRYKQQTPSEVESEDEDEGEGEGEGKL